MSFTHSIAFVVSLCASLIVSTGVAQAATFEQFFENQGMVMLLIDPESGQIINANQAAANFYGYSRDELTTKSIQQINTLSDQQVAQERQLAKSQGRNYFIFRHQLANGELRSVQVYSYPYQFEQKTLLASVIYDLDLNLKSDSAALHFNKLLEKEVELQLEETKKQNLFIQLLLIGGLLVFALLSLALWLINLKRKKAES